MKPEGEKEYSFSGKRSNLLFIVLIIGLTLAYAIDFGEIKQLPSIYMQVNKIYVAAAMATMLLFFCCQSIIVNRLLHAFGYAPTQRQTYRYTLIDYYFSSITPGASGGQPSEIF
ncbi:lysylphosphatidylglycerol synthase domain-containing protein, partial [Aedoeadaptatus coxii]